ncbi:hypothetical protein KQI86_03945 [Clostridium sp. MSJ-11]|uniref:Uncharacterized protein n=1 Tax=Clostridium mobile TaxID=2841512 RepID=A0ABS6EE35_9CLOT|nr:hypothetical protein [Clostridium mobile]MBU5483468.1 hypothetical protein [Clostridium mobile]
MADDLGIRLEINFEEYGKVNSKLQKLLGQLQQNNKLVIQIDNDSISNAIINIESQLNALKNQMYMSLNIDTTNLGENIDNIRNQIKELNGEINKVKSSQGATSQDNEYLPNLKSKMHEFSKDSFLDEMLKSTNEHFKPINKSIGESITSTRVLINMTHALGGSTAMLTTQLFKLKAQQLLVAASSVAMQAAITMGISVGISLLSSFIDKVMNADKHLKEFNKNITQSTKDTAKSISDVENLMKQSDKLQIDISNSKSEEERNKFKKELIEVQKNIADIMPETVSDFSDENEAIAANNDLIAEQLELKKKRKILEAEEFFDKNKNIEAQAEEYKRLKDELEELELAKANGQKTITRTIKGKDELTGEEREYTIDVDVNTALDAKYKRMEEISEIVSQANTLTLFLNKYSGTSRDLIKLETDEIKKNTYAKKENQYSMSAEPFEKLAKSFMDTKNVLAELNKAQDEYSNNSKYSESTLNSLLEKFPELLNYLNDEKALHGEIDKKIQEQKSETENAYKKMIMASDKYYQNNIGGIDKLEDRLKQHGITLSKGQREELQNAKNLAEAKIAVEQELVLNLNDLWGKYYKIQGDIFESMKLPDDDWADTLLKGTKASSLAKEGEGKDIYSQIQELTEQLQKSKEVFDEIGAEIKVPYFSSGDIDNSNSKTIDNSNSKKEIEDINLKTDRYKQLNDAIQDVQNQIESYQQINDRVYNQEKINNLEKEIDLLNKKQGLYKQLNEEQLKERVELKGSLGNQGVKFGSRGEITNYQQILSSKQSWANSLSGEAKENAKKQVENLQEEMNKYLDLTFKTYVESGKAIKEIDKLKEDIRKQQLEIKIKIHDTGAEKIKKEIDDVQYKLDILDITDKENYKVRAELINEIIYKEKEERDYRLKVIEDLENQLKSVKENSDQWTLINETTDRYKQNIKDLNISILNHTESLKRQNEEILGFVKSVEDKIIEIIRKNYEEQQKLAKESKQKEMKLEDERHKKRLENLEKEKQGLIDIVDLQLKELEEKISKDEYDKKLENLQKERNTLQQKYDSLALVDTIQGRAMREGLLKDLNDLDEKIEEEKYKRNNELKKKELEELKKNYSKDVDEKKKAEDKKYEDKKQKLEEEMKEIDKYYEGRLEKDNLYREVRQVINSGLISDVKGNLIDLNIAIEEYENKWGEGLSALGNKIKTELIDNLEKVRELLKDGVLEKINNNISESNDSNISQGKKKVYAMSNDRAVNDYTNAKEAFDGNDYEVIDISKMSEEEIKRIRINIGDVIVGVAEDKFKNNDTNSIADKIPIGKNTEKTKEEISKYLKKRSYMRSGFIAESQLAVPYRSTSNFEAVLNTSQINELTKRTVSQTASNCIPYSLLDSMNHSSNSGYSRGIEIDKLINIEGNATSDIIPKIEQAGNNAIEKLYQKMKGLGHI